MAKNPVKVKVFKFIEEYEEMLSLPNNLSLEDKKALVDPVTNCLNRAFLDYFGNKSDKSHEKLVKKVEQETGVSQ